jgi:hypothetical protein
VDASEEAAEFVWVEGVWAPAETAEKTAAATTVARRKEVVIKL